MGMRKRRFRQDFYIVLLSILLAFAIVYFNAVPALLAATGENYLVAAFVAGMFFTSVMTTAPAIAFLGVLALQLNPFVLALVGGVGAVCGDYLIFAFVRDRVSGDLGYLIQKEGGARLFKIFERKTFRWLLPFIGGLIIASPLPDELGLALLGVAKLRTSRFVLISFTFNALGILLIALAAQALS